MEIGQTVLDDTENVKYKAIWFQKHIKFAFPGEMECARHYETFCFVQDQDAQHQDHEETYGDLYTPYILNIYNCVKCRNMDTEEDTVFWLHYMPVPAASFLGLV